MFRGQWFKVDEFRSLGVIAVKINSRNTIQKGAILKLFEPVLFRAGAAIGIVASVCLSDEDAALRIDRHAVQQGADGVDHFDQPVSIRVEDEQVAVGNVRVLYDVDHVPK